MTRAQFILLYLALTGAIATGLAIFFSASTIISLTRTATEDLFLPILLSMIMAFLMEPAVSFLEGIEVSRVKAIFVIYILLGVIFYLAVAWLSPQWAHMWSSLATDLPRYTGKMISLIKDGQVYLEARMPFVINYDLPTKARDLAESMVAYTLVQAPKSALRLGSLMILVPLFSFFFLRDGNRILRTIIRLAPNRYFEMVHDLSYLISRQMAHFIRGRILEAAIVGLIVGLGLSLTDIRYVPLLGLFAGVTNLIPYIGPLIGMVPGILIALVDLGMGGQFWWIVLVYVVISQIIVDNFILIPILISRFSDLHPLWVIIAILMGGKLYGILGMIIGVPVASIIKIAIIETRQYRSTFSLPGTLPEVDR